MLSQLGFRAYLAQIFTPIFVHFSQQLFKTLLFSNIISRKSHILIITLVNFKYNIIKIVKLKRKFVIIIEKKYLKRKSGNMIGKT